MIFTCIIVDDDCSAIEYLSECIKQVSALNLLKVYTDPKQALVDIKKLDKPIDFLFTDVEMPDLSGLTLAKEIKAQVKCLVLVTAHTKYALAGYEINARQFLTKPFNFEKFRSLIDGLLFDLTIKEPSILVNVSVKAQVKLYISNIIAVEANGNYVKIHTTCEMLSVYSSFKAIVEKLAVYSQFKKISKSFMISVKHIERRDGYAIFLKNDISCTVGESHRSGFNKNFFDWLNFK